MRYDVLPGAHVFQPGWNFAPDPELINDLLRKAKNGFPAMSDSERDRFLLHLSSYYARITEAEGVLQRVENNKRCWPLGSIGV